MNTFRNRVQLIGRVGADPEIINLEDGKKLAKFSMATNERYRDKNGDLVQVTDWHHVNFWNKTASIVEKFVFKGNEIAVEGKLSSRSWEDTDGIRHYLYHVVGMTIVLIGNKKEEEKLKN